MGLIKVYGPSDAGRIIDRRLSRVEKAGFTGKDAFARFIRPGNISAKFTASVFQDIRIKEVELSPKTSAPLNLGLLFDRDPNPKSNMVAMEKEVTIGQMRQFVQETGYKPDPESHNADEFSKKITKGDASAPMVFTNAKDCLAFIKWAVPKAQAQDSRIQTLGLPSDEEWLDMRQTFGNQQTGNNWERLSDNYFRSFRLEVRNGYSSRERRYGNSAFRLVGTYKKD